MSGSRKMRLGGLLVAVALLLLAGGWIFGRDAEAASTDNAYIRGDITSVAPKIGGYVVTVGVADNQSVEAGDVLFRIEDREYRAKLDRANAQLDGAKARLANVAEETGLQRAIVRQSEANRRATSADFGLASSLSDRRRELIGGGAVSQAAVDESDAGLKRAAAGVSAASAAVDAQRQKIRVLGTQHEAAAAAVAQAVAERDLAEIDLKNTVVRAPIAGVIGNRQVRVGRLVAPGTPLLDIVPIADLYVVANFKETQLENVRPGQPVLIEVDGYPGTKVNGVVDSLAPGSGSAFSLIPSDSATGNFVRVVQRVPVKIRLRRNPLQGRLVPGLSARVQVLRGQPL